MPKKNVHAVALGRKGGRAKSAAKAAASRRNGLKAAILRQIAKEQAEKTGA